jgi:L-rhamnose isomerase
VVRVVFNEQHKVEGMHGNDGFLGDDDKILSSIEEVVMLLNYNKMS